MDLVRTKLDKAREFLTVADAAVANSQWDAGASLAVSAGVNAADALTLHRLGRFPQGRSHDEIVPLLRKCGPAGDSVIRHLRHLGRVKTKAQYAAARCTSKEAEDAVRYARRAYDLVRQSTQKGF